MAARLCRLRKQERHGVWKIRDKTPRNGKSLSPMSILLPFQGVGQSLYPTQSAASLALGYVLVGLSARLV